MGRGEKTERREISRMIALGRSTTTLLIGLSCRVWRTPNGSLSLREAKVESICFAEEKASGEE